MNSYTERKKFLTDMFTKAPVDRHGFLVKGGIRRRAWEIGDFATSERPLTEFLPFVLETYQTSLKYFDLPGNDGIPMIDLNYGTHIFAAALGAKIFFPEKSSPCGEPFINSAKEADKFVEPDIENCRPLVRVIEMAKLVQAELGSDVVIGPPDLQTGFDIACIIWDKTDILCSMYEAPDAVHSLRDKCSNVLTKFLKALKCECPNSSLNGYVWSPSGVHLSNDECGIMNNEMFETFCLPELLRLSREIGGLSMHCCANASHQFESFRKIPDFYAFNRVPTGIGWEKDNALEVLGGPSGPVMIPGAPELSNINIMLEKAPPKTRFIFLYQMAPSLDEAEKWLEGAYELSAKLRR